VDDPGPTTELKRQQAAFVNAPVVHIRLSGTVKVLIDGTAAPITANTQRLVLALMAGRGHPVSSDVLADRLFSDRVAGNDGSAAMGGPGAIRVAVARARQQFGLPGLITSDQTGYRLAVAETNVDLWRFEHFATTEMESAPSLQTIEMQLADWGGVPFGQFRELTFLLPIAARLEEIHRTLVERHLDELLHAGQHDKAVVHSESAVTAEPYRERRWEQLMLALYRSGRQAEALRTYQRARDILADGAGLEPGRGLRELESRMLRQDPYLDQVQRVTQSGVGTLADSQPLGRELLRAEINGLLQIEAPADRPSVHTAIYVVGEPGSGKTTLLKMISTTAERHHWKPLSIVASQHPAIPCEPLREMLRLVPQSATESLDTRVSVAITQVSGGVVSDAVHLGREEMISVLGTHIATQLQVSRSLLIVDDAQWLDSTTSAVLRAVIAEGNAPLLFASRPEPTQLLDLGSDDIVTFDLTGVDRQETTRLLESWGASSAVLASAEELFHRSGGNPLLLRMLAETSVLGGSTSALDESVQAVIGGRLQELPLRVRTMLGYASLMASPIEVEVLEQLLPFAASDVIEAIDARLLKHVDSLHVEFVHGLVAEAITSGLSDGRRAELHDMIGRHFKKAGEPPSRYARHLLEASSLDALQAVTAALDAAQEQEQACAFDEAQAFCSSAFEILDAASIQDPRLRARALIQSASALRRNTDPRARDLALDGARIAQNANLSELIVDAALELTAQARSRQAGADDVEVSQLLERALGESTDPTKTTRLLAAAASVLSLSSNRDRGRSLFLQSKSIAETLDRPDILRTVLGNIDLGLSQPDDFGARLEATEQFRNISAEDDDEWECAFLDLGHALSTGKREWADESLARLKELSPLSRRKDRSFGEAFSEAGYLHATGDLAGAQRMADVALSIGLDRYSESWAMAVYSGIVFSISIANGTAGSLLGVVDQLIADQPEFISWRCGAAFAALQAGDISRAQHEYEWAMRDRCSHLAFDHTWGPAMFCLAEVAVALHDTAGAEVLFELLAPYSGRIIWAGTCVYGPYDRCLGRLQQTLGNNALAETLLQRSNLLASGLGCEFYVVTL
jgi:DNA-binding SARP family transcriptional activator